MTNKLKVFGTAFAVLAMVVPMAVSADVDSKDYGLKVNGLTSDSVDAGDNVSITSVIDVNGDTQAEYVRTRFTLNGTVYVSQCDSIGTVTDADERAITKSIETPSDLPEGNYKVERDWYGLEDEPRAAGCANADQIDGGDFNGAQSWSGRLFIDDNQGNTNDNGGNSGPGGTGNGNSGGTGSSDTPSWLASLLAAIAALKPATTTPPVTPTHSADCVQLKNLATGLMFGSGGNGNPWQKPSVVALQSFLISKGGNTIPTGYYGMLTGGAYSMVYSQLQCHN